MSFTTTSHVPDGLLPHGGQLRAAVTQFSIPLPQWLDLSTGINPNGWPTKMPPETVWSRLPEDDDELESIACRYYGVHRILPVAGSQAAIQALPRLRAPSRVGVLHPGFSEHSNAWQSQHHEVTAITADQIDNTLSSINVLVLTQPNNPTGATFDTDRLVHWHEQLAARGGWLIVDEAYMDATPERNIAAYADSPGLIVLRSLGKFFGLAGARVGFVCAEARLLAQLRQLLGPWAISHPSRWIASQALQDAEWQHHARQQLLASSNRLQTLLIQNQLHPTGSCAFFHWIVSPHAAAIHRSLAEQGILVRRFDDPPSIRLGLPASEDDWLHLESTLAHIAAIHSGTRSC